MNRADKLSKYQFNFWLKHGILIQIRLSPEFIMVLPQVIFHVNDLITLSRVQGPNHSLGILAVFTKYQTFCKAFSVTLNILRDLGFSPQMKWSRHQSPSHQRSPYILFFSILPDTFWDTAMNTYQGHYENFVQQLS